jgi:hypothetical protein
MVSRRTPVKNRIVAHRLWARLGRNAFFGNLKAISSPIVVVSEWVAQERLAGVARHIHAVTLLRRSCKSFNCGTKKRSLRLKLPTSLPVCADAKVSNRTFCFDSAGLFKGTD